MSSLLYICVLDSCVCRCNYMLYLSPSLGTMRVEVWHLRGVPSLSFGSIVELVDCGLGVLN